MSRIAILLKDYSLLGGVEKVTANLVKLLKHNAINFSSIISLEQSNLIPLIDYPDNLNFKVINSNSLKQQRKILGDYLDEQKISSLIVQVQELKIAFWVSEVCNSLKINCIPVLHNSPLPYVKWYFPSKFSSPKAYFRFLKMKFYWRPRNVLFFKRLINEAGKIICVSETAANELNDLLSGQYHDRIKFIHNPLDLDSRKIEIVKKENYLVFAGRLDEVKCPMLLLKIWKNINFEFSSWNLKILGDGPFMHQMQEYIKNNDLQNIELLGNVQNVEDYYKMSKIGILLSYYEGFPTSLLEAAYNENALIAFNGDGGASEIVINEETGFLLSLHDIVGVEDSLKKLMRSEDLRESMGKRAKIRLNHFSDEKIFQKWSQLLR